MEKLDAKISFFKRSKDTAGSDIALTDFIHGVINGRWQDDVLRVRAAKTVEEKRTLKQNIPAATISGSFSKRKDSEMRKHSGFIAIDIDDVKETTAVKEMIKKDPYIYAAFQSVGGFGLCLLFRIDPERHLDAFNGIAKYLYDSYQLIVDQSGKNLSRLRYVSFDPYANINEDALLFKKYLPKPKVKKTNKVVFVENDFDRIVNEIYSRGINITEDYSDWIAVAYAIASEFGDSDTGRNYFHTISSLSSKYNADDCERQYASCLRTLNPAKKQSTIATIYHFAKVNGIELYSKQTKDIVRAASSQHKSGVSRDDIAAGLHKYNDIPKTESIPVIDQVISQGIEYESDNIIDDIMHFLTPYGLRKNLVTRNVEINGKPIDDADINTLFIECKSIFEKTTKDLICSVIFSNKIEQYHPLREFFEGDPSTAIDLEIDGTPNLDKLLKSIISDTNNKDKWITKWLVSCVASAYGDYSPLVLVLSGERQGTGKTYWFRYILPKQLRYLFGESKMDNGKDDEILMTKKLIILDDEYGGKSKREEKKLKEITAKEFINVREPYGRVSVDLRRISVFAGTSNDTQIISDPTGNRRILPIHVVDINQQLYNDCDKVALWRELFALYESGYDYTVLRSEIEELSESAEMFNASTPEEELIFTKTRPAIGGVGEWMTITEIIKYISMDTKYVFSNTRIGLILSKHGYEKKRQRRGNISAVVYHVEKLDNHSQPPSEFSQNSPDPF